MILKTWHRRWSGLLLALVLYTGASGQLDLPVPILATSCGIAGTSSEAIAKMDLIVSQKDYDALLAGLKSLNTADRYLSVVVAEILVSKELIRLTAEQEELVKRAYQSTSRVGLCQGCSYQATISLSALLQREELDHFAAQLANNIQSRYSN